MILCRRNVKEESLEFEQVLDLLEVRPQEDASYKEEWASNRQRALALVSHIVDCEQPLRRHHPWASRPLSGSPD